jgi:nitroreductase
MSEDLRSTMQAECGPDGCWPDDSLALARLLTQRYSCRGYRDEAVPRHVIERMLGLAQLSPSWCNSQPWQVIVTEGNGTERLRKALYARALLDVSGQNGAVNPAPDFAFPSAYRGIYKERQREVGWQLYESVGIAYGDRTASALQVLKNFRLFDAPHVLLITSEFDLGTYGAIDCGVYLSSLLLAAQSLGVAAIPQAALASYAPFMREHFEIPKNRMLVAGVSFGYADAAHPSNGFRSKRAPIREVVQWISE